MDFLHNLTRRQLIGFATLLFLLVAIPATFYLIRQQQILRSRAVGERSRIEFRGASGQVIRETQTQLVNLRLYWDTNPPVTTPTSTPTPTRTSTLTSTPTTAQNTPTPAPQATAILYSLVSHTPGMASVNWASLSPLDTDWVMVPFLSSNTPEPTLAKRLSGNRCSAPDTTPAPASASGICFLSGLQSGQNYLFGLVHGTSLVAYSSFPITITGGTPPIHTPSPVQPAGPTLTVQSLPPSYRASFVQGNPITISWSNITADGGSNPAFYWYTASDNPVLASDEPLYYYGSNYCNSSEPVTLVPIPEFGSCTGVVPALSPGTYRVGLMLSSYYSGQYIRARSDPLLID